MSLGLQVADYLEFQSHILGKEVVFIADIDVIKSNKEKESQCRLATIRILVDPIYKTRSILYFRVKTKDHPLPGFVEWPSMSHTPSFNIGVPLDSLVF